MKKVTPYKTTRNAMVALDNGGRFYNWSSKAGDGNISPAELRKAAGVMTGAQNMIIYLEMSLANFDRDEKHRVLSFLTPDLKVKYDKYQPTVLQRPEDQKDMEAGSAAIVSGTPKLVDSKSEFTGFIMVPVYAGKTMTFTMVPIIEAYDIYELHQGESGDNFFIGHGQSSKKLPQQPARLGGILKELSSSPDKATGSDKFLEITHYTLLG